MHADYTLDMRQPGVVNFGARATDHPDILCLPLPLVDLYPQPLGRNRAESVAQSHLTNNCVREIGL